MEQEPKEYTPNYIVLYNPTVKEIIKTAEDMDMRFVFPVCNGDVYVMPDYSELFSVEFKNWHRVAQPFYFNVSDNELEQAAEQLVRTCFLSPSPPMKFEFFQLKKETQ